VGKTHARIGVQERYFSFMGEALMETLAQTLGPEKFSPEIEREWNIVYEALASNMIHAMNIENKVLASWNKLKAVENYEEVAGGLLFQEMFRTCPETKMLFGFPLDLDVESNVILESRRFKTHAKYFIDMIDRTMGMVKAKQVEEHMKELGDIHSEFGVKDEYFPIMGSALLHTLKIVLKDDFNDETKLAWEDVYGRLSSRMISAIKASRSSKS